MAPVEELDGLIQSMQALKAPGVSKPKVDAITALCRENIQSEGLLVQKIYTSFSRAAPNYKLGVIYVVDSVSRDWVNHIRKSGQTPHAGTASEGTFQAGIQKMSEILPRLMKQLFNVAPENQEEKIQKLLSIWTNHGTFPGAVLKSIEQEWQTVKGSRSKPASAPYVPSVTPPGDPPAHVLASLGLRPPEPKPPASAAPDINAILAGLANPPREEPKPAIPQPPQPAPQHQYAQPAFQQLQAVQQQQQPPPQTSANAASANPLAALSALQYLGNAGAAAPPQQPAQPAPAPAPAPQAAPAQNPVLAANPQLQVQLLQALVQSGGQLPPEQLAQVLAVLGMGNQQAAAAPAQAPPSAPAQQGGPPAANGYGDPRSAQYSRDRDDDPRRRPNGDGPRYRDRSRSPEFRRGRGSPPNRRDSPTYGNYEPAPGHRDGEGRRGRKGGRSGLNEYRQRSPPRQRGASPTMPASNIAPKWIDHDPNLPPDHIRVLSRTLFVGGVSAPEAELKNVFARFGEVQSCIVNMDKRHAFVKMYDRKAALAARIGMEHEKDPEILNKVRSTRWGVGFGPRECSDYTSGISVIPIDRLTDADRKWILTAEYGGTGGIPLESGMVVEEPDIEIGQGVSSKAISRRVGPDHTGRPDRGGFGGGRGGGFRGGHNDHGGGGGGGGRGRGRHGDRGSRHQHQHQQQAQAPRGPEPDTVGVPPAVPGFGFQLPGMP